jgi:imidazolonepropionase-like amidohydrolase
MNQQTDKLSDADLEYGRRVFELDLRIVGEMKKAGVVILAGADGGYAQGGEALDRELELLVRAGLTPVQALQAASRDAAAAVGAGAEVGTLEVGKTADMVLLDADPLADIANVRRVKMVIVRGRPFAPARPARPAASAAPAS